MLLAMGGGEAVRGGDVSEEGSLVLGGLVGGGAWAGGGVLGGWPGLEVGLAGFGSRAWSLGQGRRVPGPGLVWFAGPGGLVGGGDLLGGEGSLVGESSPDRRWAWRGRGPGGGRGRDPGG